MGNHYITFKFKPNTAEKKREIAREIKRESERERARERERSRERERERARERESESENRWNGTLGSQRHLCSKMLPETLYLPYD